MDAFAERDVERHKSASRRPFANEMLRFDGRSLRGKVDACDNVQETRPIRFTKHQKT